MTDIEKNVMRRVHTIRMLRPLVSGAAFSMLLLVLALYGIGREVWVAKVFANGPQDLVGHLQYLGYAFLHTRLVVQALALASLAAVVVLARETAKVLAALLVKAVPA